MNSCILMKTKKNSYIIEQKFNAIIIVEVKFAYFKYLANVCNNVIDNN